MDENEKINQIVKSLKAKISENEKYNHVANKIEGVYYNTKSYSRVVDAIKFLIEDTAGMKINALYIEALEILEK